MCPCQLTTYGIGELNRGVGRPGVSERRVDWDLGTKMGALRESAVKEGESRMERLVPLVMDWSTAGDGVGGG